MPRISKEFTFSASHQLSGLPEDHPCSRLHGHNYRVIVEVTGCLNKVGFVVDYRDFDPFKHYLDGALDHRHLNDVIEDNPTAENLAARLCEVFVSLVPVPMNCSVKVGVSETPKTWAWT